MRHPWVLSKVLDAAVADDLLSSNPARRVERPRKNGETKGRRGNALTRHEFRQFIAAIPKSGLSEDVSRLLEVVAWSGCRRGEALCIRTSNCADGELLIRHSVWHGHEKLTKSNDPRRIAMVGPLKEALDKQWDWLFKTRHPAIYTGLLFPASPKHALAVAKKRGSDTPSWFRSMNVLDKPIRRVVAVAGVKPISLHSLRRTFENLMRRAGVKDLVRRSLAGWRSEQVQRGYAEIDPSERRAAADALVTYIFDEGA